MSEDSDAPRGVQPPNPLIATQDTLAAPLPVELRLEQPGPMRPLPGDDGRFRDDDGWVIPLIGRPVPNGQPLEERENQRRLVSILLRHGWEVQEHVDCYNRDGDRLIPDVIARHPVHLPEPGGIEVKARITCLREHYDAAKQAIDYGQTKILATGQRLVWSAVYPFQPPPPPAPEQESLWPVLGFTAAHYKSVAFLDGDHARKVGAPGAWQTRLVLLYKRENRLWSDRDGFVHDAVHMLTGKRKVGGRRK